MRSSLRTALALASGGLLLVPFASAASASPASNTKTTVTGSVVDGDGDPVRGVSVFAFRSDADLDSDDGFVVFSNTSKTGTFSREQMGQLSAGT